jgi:hypothetical protein
VHQGFEYIAQTEKAQRSPERMMTQAGKTMGFVKNNMIVRGEQRKIQREIGKK